MYEITYKRKAIKDLAIIERDSKMMEDFELIIEAIGKNPYRPELPPSRIPENGIKLSNTKIDTYHVKLTPRDRIFYRVDEWNKTIIIDEVEYQGNVKLLQLLGHDL